MLMLLLSCSFVEPPPPAPAESSSRAVAKAQRLREHALLTDGGAMLWRAVDAHGGMVWWLDHPPQWAPLEVNPTWVNAPWSLVTPQVEVTLHPDTLIGGEPRVTLEVQGGPTVYLDRRSFELVALRQGAHHVDYTLVESHRLKVPSRLTVDGAPVIVQERSAPPTGGPPPLPKNTRKRR